MFFFTLTYISDVDDTDLRPEQVQLEGCLPVSGELEGREENQIRNVISKPFSREL